MKKFSLLITKISEVKISSEILAGFIYKIQHLTVLH